MTKKVEIITKPYLKKDLPDIRPGNFVKVYEKFIDKDKEKKHVFEGIVISKKHGKGVTGTITVRNEVKGVGVERVFPIHSPNIEKIEISQKHKVRRAKLYYLRNKKGKKLKLKKK